MCYGVVILVALLACNKPNEIIVQSPDFQKQLTVFPVMLYVNRRALEKQLDDIVIVAEIGEAGVIARRKGEDWFVGGIIGENSRTIELDFSFLEEDTSYKATVYTDDESVKTRTRVKIEENDLDNQQLDVT